MSTELFSYDVYSLRAYAALAVLLFNFSLFGLIISFISIIFGYL